MRRRVVTSLLVQTCAAAVSITLASAAASAADTLGASDETPAQTAQTGPLPGYQTGEFRIRPSLSVSETFDNNVFATDRDPHSDWITRLSPQLRIDSTWDRHSLKMRAGAEAGRYWDFDAENYLDRWVSAEGRYDISADTLVFGGAGYSFAHEGRDSPDAESAGLSPTTYRKHNAHLGMRTQLGATQLRLGTTYESLDFDDVRTGTGWLINDDRDREQYGAGLRLTHDLTPIDQLFVQALYDGRDYRMAQDQDGFERDSDGYRLALGLRRDLGGSSNAEAYVGTLHQTYADDRFDAITRPDFGARLSLVPSRSTKLSAELQRSLNETTLSGSPGYLSDRLSARLEHRVMPRLTPYLALSYEIADYLQSPREDRSYSADLGIKYYLARNAYILTGVSHLARDARDAGSSGTSDDFSKDTVYLSFVTQGYPLFEPGISSFETEAEAGLGALWVAEDAVRFGRYNGLDEAGLYWNGDVHMTSRDGERGYAHIKGLDLGLDTRSIAIDWGSQGRYDAFVHYDEIPFRDFIGLTPFEGVGGTQLRRPDGWVAADTTDDMQTLDEHLSEVEIGTVRKRLGAGTLLHADHDRWTLAMGYETESKDGIDEVAGVVGNSPGNARSVMLPVPIDYTTNTLTASLGYGRARSQFDLSYRGSFFYNNLTTLGWESLYDEHGPRAADGEIALPPDSQMHQLSLSGGHSLGATTRITAVASAAVMLQDEAFVDDFDGPGLASHPLPRDSLEGEAYLYNGLIALSSRPLRGLNLKASYRLQKRDNQTPLDDFAYLVSGTGGDPDAVMAQRRNEPYSYDRRTMRLDAGYRLNRLARLSGEAVRETIERSPSEVSRTTEDRGRLRLRLDPTDDLQLSLSGGVASRTGSDYETLEGENPLLRKYNISDRDRVSYGADLSYQASKRLTLGASLDISDDDYDATQVGLTDARRTSTTLDATYVPNRRVNLHGYLGRELYRSHQRGSEIPNSPDWAVANEDQVDSLGLGIGWRRDSRLELGADYVLSRSTGDTQLRSPGTGPQGSDYPTQHATLHSLRLHADYKLRKDTKLKLSYQYEHYDVDDWATDGVGSDGISEVLLLDEPNPSYNQHVVGLSVVTRF